MSGRPSYLRSAIVETRDVFNSSTRYLEFQEDTKSVFNSKDGKGFDISSLLMLKGVAWGTLR
jgi:hypothetical protein